GYLKDAQATEALWAGGWMHTGDIMKANPDGTLCFVDRRKNIVRRSGENIAAIEVEAAIADHPAVARVAVLAALDPLRGEEVLAVVVPAAGFEPGEALARTLFGHCAARLAYYKLPGFVTFVATIPMTSTQKVRKAELVQLAADPIAHPGTIDLRTLKQGSRHARR
ncbi:MAG: AMP-binding protein, partial [Burkholderiales bacterium]